MFDFCARADRYLMSHGSLFGNGPRAAHVHAKAGHDIFLSPLVPKEPSVGRRGYLLTVSFISIVISYNTKQRKEYLRSSVEETLFQELCNQSNTQWPMSC